MPRRPRSFLLIGLILMLAPLMAYAQDEEIPPLTETFTVADYELDFQYPADWEIIGQSGTSVMLSAPIGGTGVPNQSGVGVEGSGTVVFWSFDNSGASAATLALAAAENFVEDETSVFELTEAQEFRINGQEAAQIDAVSLVFLQRYIGMELENGPVVIVEIIGFEEGVLRVTPIALEMLATVRESGAPLPEVITPALTQNHTRAADQTSFSLPADWLIEETDNYTLLTAPNGVTVGISSEPLPGIDDIVLDTIALISDSLTRQIPDVELDEVEEFEVNSQRAARVTGISDGIYFGFWAIDLSGEVVGHISVIGPPQDVADLDQTIFAIAETITTGQVAEGGESVSALTLSETITSDDGAFTVNYPKEWSALTLEDFVLLTSGDVDLGDVERELQAGEHLIIVQNGLGFIAEGSGINVPQTSDPATVARAVALDAEENGNPQTIEKLTLNGRAASVVYGPEGNRDRYVLVFALPDGELASLIAVTAPGELESLFDVFVAIAASMSPR